MFEPYWLGRAHGYIVYARDRAIKMKQCLTHIQRKNIFLILTTHAPLLSVTYTKSKQLVLYKTLYDVTHCSRLSLPCMATPCTTLGWLKRT